MRNYLTGALVIGLGMMAGCSSDTTPVSKRGQDAQPSARAAKGALSLIQRHESAPGFASLPDRGELLAYDSMLKVKRVGAFTAYPVAISEEHALNAIVKGDLVVNTPNGEQVRLKYGSYVEHDNGDWSWIGRDASGAEAILTFGQGAVFGTIPQQGGGDWRLTMAGGRAWMVSTDRSKLGNVHLAGKPDVMVPPKFAVGAVAASAPEAAGMAAPLAGEASAVATTVVDVQFGYSNGFADMYGGQGGAVTRINNLIDRTNQAYANSGISMRIRYVGALQVTYADNTDNGGVLQKMSGFDSSGSIPVDPAFTALRTARETNGADLVVFMRRFRAPENAGCGIAWILGGHTGGGNSSISVGDAPYGYSVVSDGDDLGDDGNSYYCLNETLAHELGHNMGQAHNTQDSQTDEGELIYGVHTYSFGYREATSVGRFHTVMAYPLSDASGVQEPINYFANPSITYQGRPTGVANQSDNARSLNQTMPIISQFRATVKPVRSRLRDDINKDGKSDLVWHSASLQKQQGWRMDGAKIATYAPVNNIGSIYSSSGLGDFNGDGYSDIVWVDSGKTEVWIWQGKADGIYTPMKVRAYPAGWNIVAIADTNGDLRDDIVWHNATTGQVQVWRMNGKTISYGPVSTIGTYKVAAVGDFNGDGLEDLIWIDNGKTRVWEWLSQANGTFTAVSVRSFPGGDWTIVGTGDSNGDGRSDLFWHSQSLGRLQVWKMIGATVTYGPTITFPGLVGAVGDFNGDGYSDVVRLDAGKTRVELYTGKANGTYGVALIRAYPAGWSLLNRKPFQ
ncbi:FG-GAP-like repeat-containing protein [Luteimonas aquatica]|uniref:FG-GAP-like repeat-containing protein n=1 Tax=Luteimonas aquatica TaxID=450364 RepID=UPI001F57875F|nr:FG-GAP-like repeat-containing protein [Luteimonas aquatica]